MSQVTFRLYAAAAEAAGTHQLNVAAGEYSVPLRELVCELTAGQPTSTGSGPSLQRVCGQSSFLINGTRCDLSTAHVNPGDVVDILPPFAGG